MSLASHEKFCYSRKDLDYWMLNEDWIDECCVEKYVGMREKILEEMEITAAGLRTVNTDVMVCGLILSAN